MLLISLGCSDLVLGIEWLVKLGNITWNFDKLTMEFHVQVSQGSFVPHGRQDVLTAVIG